MKIIFRNIQYHRLFQRGNKNINKNFTTKRKILMKRQLKNNLFTEISSSQPVDKKDNATILRQSKSIRSNTSATILHPLNKNSLPSSTIGILKKQRKTKLASDVPKKILLKKKVFSAYKIEKELWQNKGESSDRNMNKRKIEKKLCPTGNASTSVRPPNKKRKKSKIM